MSWLCTRFLSESFIYRKWGHLEIGGDLMRQFSRKWKWVVIESGHYIYNEEKSPLYPRGRVLDPATNSMKLRGNANFRKFWTSNLGIELYTNRCRILCWFQKCIPLYHYFEYLMSYGILKVKCVFFCARRQIFSLKCHNSLYIQNNGMKAYIF